MGPTKGRAVCSTIDCVMCSRFPIIFFLMRIQYMVHFELRFLHAQVDFVPPNDYACLMDLWLLAYCLFVTWLVMWRWISGYKWLSLWFYDPYLHSFLDLAFAPSIFLIFSFNMFFLSCLLFFVGVGQKGYAWADPSRYYYTSTQDHHVWEVGVSATQRQKWALVAQFNVQIWSCLFKIHTKMRRVLPIK